MDQVTPPSPAGEAARGDSRNGTPMAPVKGRPLAVYLVLLGFAIAVPSLIFSGYLLYRFADLEQESAARSAQDAAAAIRDSVDREIAGMVTQLKVLAASPALENGDLRTYYDSATAGLTGTDTFLSVIDPSYVPLLNTRVPYGTPLEPLVSKASVDEPLKTANVYVSDVFFGPVANDYVFNVGLPVTTRSGARFVLLMTRSAARLGRIISEQNLAPGWRSSIIDREGNVVVSSGSERVGSPAKLLSAPGIGEGNVAPRAHEIDGNRVVFAIRKSFDTGWRIAAWVPASIVEAPVWSSMRALGLAALALLMLTGLLAILFGRRVSRPLLLLADQARALGRGETLPELTSTIREVNEVSRTLVTAADERMRTEQHIRFLMRELSHRAKNQLAVVVAMARRTAERNPKIGDFENVFSERLLALARSTDLLVNQNWAGVAVDELVRAHLSPFSDEGRLIVSGPPIQINPDAAQNIGLALHELATNASKYGALTTPDGKVSVVWKIVAGMPQRFRREWLESDGPPVTPPRDTGFGSVVIERTVPHSLDADVIHEFRPTGVFWSIELPLESIVARRPVTQAKGSAA
jgi:two-component sensor histidine kinase